MQCRTRCWASTAVEATTTYRLHGRPLASLLAFGYDTTTLQHYAVGAIREAVMDAIRRTRNANANAPRPMPPSRNMLGRLLLRRIYSDWERVLGSPRHTPVYTAAADKRWHPDSYCPRTKTSFGARWPPLARVSSSGALTVTLVQHGLAQSHTHNNAGGKPSALPPAVEK